MNDTKHKKTIFFAIAGIAAAAALICAALWISGAFRPLPIEAVYFYNTVCGSCDDYDRELLNRLSDANRKTLLKQDYHAYNISKTDAYAVFVDYCEKYNVPQERRATPCVFFGGEYLSGDNMYEQLGARLS